MVNVHYVQSGLFEVPETLLAFDTLKRGMPITIRTKDIAGLESVVSATISRTWKKNKGMKRIYWRQQA